MVLKPHAVEQMEERDVARFEVERVVKTGSVLRIETDPDGSERWRVAGRDSDGARIDVVVKPVLPSLLVVVTVIRVG